MASAANPTIPSHKVWSREVRSPASRTPVRRVGPTLMTSAQLLYVLIPVAAIVAGGTVAAFRSPGPGLSSAIQHFAAGAVFAAVAAELVFDLLERNRLVPLIIGFVIGTALMLVIKAITQRIEQSGGGTKQAAGLTVTSAVDVFIDGVVIAIGFAAGAGGGVLLTVALTLEVAFLGVAVSGQIVGGGSSPRVAIAASAGLALALAAGAVGGGLVVGGLSGAIQDALIAFGAAALLYLVTEELLVEAHESRENPWMTTSFFAAFLLILALEIVA